MSNLIEYPEIPNANAAYAGTTEAVEKITDALSKEALVDVLKFCNDKIRLAMRNAEFSCKVKVSYYETLNPREHELLIEMVQRFLLAKSYRIEKKDDELTISWAKPY